MGLLSRVAVKAAPGPGETEDALTPEYIRASILHYQCKDSLGGIIFDAPPDEGVEIDRDFSGRLSHICAFFGNIIPLSPRRCLLLFPKSLDGELIAHRLSRNLNIKPLFAFEAGSPEEAAAEAMNYI